MSFNIILWQLSHIIHGTSVKKPAKSNKDIISLQLGRSSLGSLLPYPAIRFTYNSRLHVSETLDPSFVFIRLIISLH